MQNNNLAVAPAPSRRGEVTAEVEHERWAHWPVHWSAVGVGALASLAAVLIFGLIGIAVGAHVLGAENRIVDLKKMNIGTLSFSIFGSFLAFAIGGWVAAKIAGILRSEPAILHGAIVWLTVIPMLLLFAGLGAGSYFGGWHAGLAGTPAGSAPAAAPYEKPDPIAVNATEQQRMEARVAMEDYQQKVKQWQADTPKAIRNAALGTVTALLLGLVGAVVGGWMASGEPMNFSHHRSRRPFNSRLSV